MKEWTGIDNLWYTLLLPSWSQRWIFLVIQEPGFLDYFFILVQLYSNQGVSCRNIGQEQLRVKQSFSAQMTIKNSLFGFNSNGLLNHGKEGKTRYYVIQCRFSEFLIQLCIKNLFFGVPCRNIAFFGVRAEILLSSNQGGLDSRAGPFLGYVQIY